MRVFSSILMTIRACQDTNEATTRLDIDKGGPGPSASLRVDMSFPGLDGYGFNSPHAYYTWKRPICTWAINLIISRPPWNLLWKRSSMERGRQAEWRPGSGLINLRGR